MIAHVLILIGLLTRFAPHAPNFTPIAAIALFAGVYLNKKTALWLPLAIMAASDLVLGLHDVVLFTWGSFFVTGLIGLWLKTHKTPANVALATVLSTALFFVVTNFGVWLVWYPQTTQGLIACYINALPFLRNTLASNIVFAVVLFGLYELAKRWNFAIKNRSVLLINE